MKKISTYLISILILLLYLPNALAEEENKPLTVAYKEPYVTAYTIRTAHIEEELDHPMLAASDTWYTGNTKRNSLTAINIVDSADETTISSATESWPAAVDQNADSELDDDIMCYINGTTLTIAGDGSGRIYMNPDSKFAFSTLGTDEFTNITEISNTHILDASKVIEMKGMFWGCSNLEMLDVSTWDTSNVTEMYSVFNTCSKLTTLDLTNWDTDNVTEMRAMFNTCSSLTEIDLSTWDTSSLESTFGMFNKCTNLKTVNLKNWDTSNVNTMSSMFQLCEALTKIEGLENFDIGNVTDLSFMFYQCPKLKTLDLRNFETGKVTSFDHIFCHSVITLVGGKDAVKNWDTSSAVNMNAMFYQIQNPVLDVSHFDTSNVKVFSQMFEGCAIEEIIGLENFDTSNGITFHEMFWNAYKIKEVNLSNFDTRKAKNGVKISENNTYSYTMKGFFGGENAGNPALEKVILGENFSFNGDGTNTNENYMFKMPTKSSASITNTYWETPDGKIYAPLEVPDKTAGVYIARDYSSPIIVLENTVYSSENKTLDVSVVLNTDLQTQNGKVLITVYSENTMLDFYYEDVSETVSHTFEKLPTAERYTVKAFCWSDFERITPLCNSIIKTVQ